ncbi:MAG: hypothetical protein R2753_13525 [Chitinophagales bacterium]
MSDRRRIVLDIDNNSNADALIDYIRSLDYVRIEEDNFEVLEWQKELVRERIKKNGDNLDNYISIDDLGKHIKL